MKVAVLSESSSDESAIRILLEGILGLVTEDVGGFPLRSRGWPAVIRILPAVLKYLHYQTDAEALAVIVDSDDSPPHVIQHDVVENEDPLCRLCQLRNTFAFETANLKPVFGREPIMFATGLAVPSIEAWYQCGLDPHVYEATWIRGLKAEPIAYTRRTLKQAVYGTERPNEEVQRRCATNAALRLADNLDLLERHFPDGFGSFARDVRNWRKKDR